MDKRIAHMDTTGAPVKSVCSSQTNTAPCYLGPQTVDGPTVLDERLLPYMCKYAIGGTNCLSSGRILRRLLLCSKHIKLIFDRDNDFLILKSELKVAIKPLTQFIHDLRLCGTGNSNALHVDVSNLVSKCDDVVRDNYECIKEAVQRHGGVLEYASDRLKDNKDIVLAAVKQSGCALINASDRLKNDREVTKAAIEANGNALSCACKKWRLDKEMVLTAVGESGSALNYASDDLKGDREVVEIAVKKEGTAIQYASKELRSDPCLAMLAIKQNPYALEFVNHYLMSLWFDHNSYKALVMAAIELDWRTFTYASDEMQKDPEVAFAAIRQDP